MDGYDALWLPGMDHAGIATQAKIDKRLRLISEEVSFPLSDKDKKIIGDYYINETISLGTKTLDSITGVGKNGSICGITIEPYEKVKGRIIGGKKIEILMGLMS